MRNAEDRLSYSKKRRRRRILLVLLGFLLLFSVLSLRIWFSSRAVELAYEINRLTAEKETLEEENRKLLLEIAKLRAPERISRIAAMGLKMVRSSSDTEVITLER